MADNQAEDDDDEGFGEFEFASFQMNTNHQIPNSSNTKANSTVSFDDWGDFVGNNQNPIEFPHSNGFSHSQSPKNLDPFANFSDQTQISQVSLPTHTDSEEKNSTAFEKKQFEKPKGALPLSLFGELEDESDPPIEVVKDVFTPKHVKTGSYSAQGVGLDDMIRNLYSHNNHGKDQNGKHLDLGNSNGDIDVDVDDEEDDDGWEFKAADSDSKEQGTTELFGRKIEEKPKDETMQVDMKRIDNSKPEGNTFVHSNGGSGTNDTFTGLDLFSPKVDETDIGFNFPTANMAQNDPVLNDFNADFDDNSWEFQDAFSETGLKDKRQPQTADVAHTVVVAALPTGKIQVNGKENSKVPEFAFGFETGAYGSSVDFNLDFSSHKSGELDVGLDNKPNMRAQNGSNSEMHFDSQEISSGNGFTEMEDNFASDWEFKDAFSEMSKDKEQSKSIDLFQGVELAPNGNAQGHESKSENPKGPIPLSIFGDVTPETDDSINLQDAFMSPAYSKNSLASQGSNVSSTSIQDLISNLYSQAEPISSLESMHKIHENGSESAQVVNDSGSVDVEDDFDANAWEFKDASTERRDENQASCFTDSYQPISTELKAEDYLHFYGKLKDETFFVAGSHLDNLKKAQSVASISGDDAKTAALDEEVKEACMELHQENMVSHEFNSNNDRPRPRDLNNFLEVLEVPKFQVLESEYHLSRRLSSAETDLGGAIELLKHAKSMLKILKLGSAEEQSSYVTTWHKMLCICAEELKHGSLIWKQCLQQNMQTKVLSEPQGKQFILALGEIYRVVKVVQTSAKLYKPWIISNLADPTKIFSLLEECSSLWSSSGFEEALQSLSDLNGCAYGGSTEALLNSINYLDGLDLPVLQDHLSTQEKQVCRLSNLSAQLVPDIKMVAWNGEHYFVTLANLWANLVCCDPPKLPCIVFAG
ncbi:hypothetical protein RJ641_023623 [Dillenia turbinata]|uniref:Synergin gamma C-terminal domain-containing protein n=1 Tax=Dillenia turbinata TaxID=194707 RepID=A0AAN8U9W6_9MAGN